REHRMAGREQQREQVIADRVVEAGAEVRVTRGAVELELAPELIVLSLGELGASHRIDRAVLGGPHQPCAGAVRDPRLRPLLERRHERVLREGAPARAPALSPPTCPSCAGSSGGRGWGTYGAGPPIGGADSIRHTASI